MRRLMVLLLGAVLVLPLGGPARAAQPEVSRWDSAGLNAFWYLTRELEGRAYLEIVWYVGVYQSTDEVFSDLYQSVVRCEREPGRDPCRSVRFSIGYSDLEGATFSVDRRLNEGFLDETYRLTTRHRNGDRTRSRAHIVAELEGVGDVSRYRESYRSGSGCTLVRYDFRGASRQAEAYGSVNGNDIGETYDAWLSRGGSVSFERTC